MMYYTKFKTTLCNMIIVGDENGVKYLHLDTKYSNRNFQISNDWALTSTYFEKEIKQIEEYLQGKRSVFDIKLNLEGTSFQKNVWKELCKIPIGSTTSYKQIATCIGNKNAYRAVGTANSKNPVAIIIPCHRVIGSNKKLNGYAFGIELKELLIELEKNHYKS